MSYHSEPLWLDRKSSSDRNGLRSYLFALNRYNITPTLSGQYQRHRVSNKFVDHSADIDDPVEAINMDGDAFYNVPMWVGQPPQLLDVNLDTGSADFWVWSNRLPKETIAIGEDLGVKTFNPSRSQSFSPLSSWFDISYMDNSYANGPVGMDQVKIGALTIKNQAIGIATHVGGNILNSTSSGLLGLSFGNMNTVTPEPAATLIENMVAEEAISPEHELFTVYLGSVKDAADPDGGQSFYTFGGIHEATVKASGQAISYTPINSSTGHWMYESPAMTVNGRVIETQGNHAIADTGTSLALVSDHVLDEIYAAVDGAVFNQSLYGWTIPAAGIAQRPNVTFAVGDKQFAIEREQLGFQRLPGTDMMYGAIQSRGHSKVDIMGATFLMCIYAIFDFGNQQFGCVQRPDPTLDGPRTQVNLST